MKKGKAKEQNMPRLMGNLAALFTIIIWGTTFISTKVLLTEFRPVEILFFRFVLGYLALLLACPHRLRTTGCGQEMTFVLAGLCGGCLYYLLENIALTYTMASNVGVIISVAPFFTAILSYMLASGKAGRLMPGKTERAGSEKAEQPASGRAVCESPEKKETDLSETENPLQASFFAGFLVAMAGVALISFQGAKFELNPMGDILAVLAAFVWACYSLLSRKISSFGYSVILSTRRTFFYGILFMIPALFLFEFEPGLERFADMTCLLNILYLGLGASALCFVTWNIAVKELGAVRTSVYIYLDPVVTVVTSMLVLKETITWISAVGTLLAIAGLFLSEYDKKGKTGIFWEKNSRGKRKANEKS